MDTTAPPLSRERPAAVSGALSILRQKRGAAEALYAMDSPAEALRLGRDAVVAAFALVETASPDATDVEAALRSLGMSDEDASEVVRTRDEALRSELPSRDEELEPTHADVFARFIRVSRAVERAFARSLRTKAQRVLVASGKIVALVAVLGLIGLGAVGIHALVEPEITARASATLRRDALYGPANTVDADLDTEWLLPDRSEGWLELRLPEPRAVSDARILNGRGAPHHDRQTRRVVVELYSRGHRVASVPYEFPRFTPTPEWVTVPAAGSDVDRVRILVQRWHRAGASLAEVHVR